jgi:acyl transferase domain-containing protein
MNSVISSKTSVFVGGGITQDYMYMLNHDTELVLKFKGTGTSGAMVSNRISWFYDLKGTSLSIDTACSSSLVALHHACQNLRHGDSEMVRCNQLYFHAA